MKREKTKKDWEQMQLKTLSLATIGLLFLTNMGTQAVKTDLKDGEPLSESYLSAFASDDNDDIEFELSDEVATIHTLEKRGVSCSKYHTSKFIINSDILSF